MSDALFTPYQLKHLTLKNRIFSSAHEPAYAEEGMPKERYRLYHEEKAKGGVALTMTAGSAIVSKDSPPAFGNLHAYEDAIVPWIKELTDGVHEHGAACMIQLTHLGRRSHWAKGDWLPMLAPSPIREAAHRGHPKQAEDWDVERIVQDFADAAERMKAGGMDGIEIESYGHLFDQWWSPITNTRQDEFGGSLENRMTVPMMILEAVRKRVGADFIVGIRMAIDEVSPDGINKAEGLEMLKRIDEAGLIDFVNVIRGRVESEVVLTEVIPIHGMPSAPHLDFSGEVRQATNLAVMHAAKIDNVASARYAIDEGKLDLVGMTRAQMADPYLVNKIRDGQESQIRPCVGATYCLDRIYEGRAALCIHNAATSRESTMPHIIEPAETKKRVVIVGAGPAGLEAARVAGERGHEVIVLEAMPKAGGQIQLAIRNPRRIDLVGIIDWRVAELERLGVDLRYNTFAEAAGVLELSPDIVVIATGGTPQFPDFEAGSNLIGTKQVSSSWDIISGDVRPTGSVLLYDDDGTHSALTAAEILAASGVELEIVTPERMFGIEVGGMNAVSYIRSVNNVDARITLHRNVMAIHKEDDKLRVELGSEHTTARHSRLVDHVVIDNGLTPLDELYFDLRANSSNEGAVDYTTFIEGGAQTVVKNPEGSYQLFRIGDAVANRNIHAAIYDGLRLAKDF